MSLLLSNRNATENTVERRDPCLVLLAWYVHLICTEPHIALVMLLLLSRGIMIALFYFESTIISSLPSCHFGTIKRELNRTTNICQVRFSQMSAVQHSSNNTKQIINTPAVVLMMELEICKPKL